MYHNEHPEVEPKPDDPRCLRCGTPIPPLKVAFEVEGGYVCLPCHTPWCEEQEQKKKDTEQVTK